VIEAELDDGEGGFDAHGMDPVQVLALARQLGPADGTLPRILVVGCEPETRMSGDEEDVVAELSAPVGAALDEAVALVGSLLAELTTDHQPEGRRP
jgi:Ni,Fe-hydrogenase maturation factor